MKKRIISSLVMLSMLLIFNFKVWANTYTFDRMIENIASFGLGGSGAIAQGMGNAYIALSEDCTGFTWNPASPTILEKLEMAFSGMFFNRTEDIHFTIDDNANGNQTVDHMHLKYFGIAYPFKYSGKHICLSIFYHKIMDFNRKWNFNFALKDNDRIIDYQSEGAMSSIGIGGCIRATKNLSFGVSFNIMNDGITKNSWEQKTYQFDKVWFGDNPKLISTSYYYNIEKYSLKGSNFNIGLLWRNIFKSNFTMGVVCKTPFHASFNKSKIDTSLNKSTNAYTLKMPLSYGIGFSYRYTDSFKCAFDMFRTEWNNFVIVDSFGRKISPITGKLYNKSNTCPTHQMRLGFEYSGFHNNKYIFPICFGMFYDPSPSEGCPDNIWGLTIGAGIVKMDKFSIDFAYQYRFGNNTSQYMLQNWGFSQDVNEHSIQFSIIMYLSK